MECWEEVKVANDYWTCVQSRSQSVVGNSLFSKKEVHKSTLVRMVEGRASVGALMEYVLQPKRMGERLLHVNVYRGESGGMSLHFSVEAGLKVVVGE